MFAQHLLKSTPNLKQFRGEFRGPGATPTVGDRRGPSGQMLRRPRSGPGPRVGIASDDAGGGTPSWSLGYHQKMFQINFFYISWPRTPSWSMGCHQKMLQWVKGFKLSKIPIRKISETILNFFHNLKIKIAVCLIFYCKKLCFLLRDYKL